MTFDKMTERELLNQFKNGNGLVVDFILDKYKYLVRKRANALFLFGGDTEDLIQEGMIGLYHAIRDYSEEKGSFAAFADICIRRQIYKTITAANREKHKPLNSYISFDDQSSSCIDSATDESFLLNGNPERMVVGQEMKSLFLKKLLFQLSALEKSVLFDYLEGLTYAQIAEKQQKTEKTIDNALQRIRRKAQSIKEFL